MSKQSPKNFQQLMELGASAMNGVRDGSVSPEKANAVADLMMKSIEFAKAEIAVIEATTRLDNIGA